MSRSIRVHILTFCRKPELFYGTELVFKTLRVGFPDARVRVVDNASLPEVRDTIARLARENDCAFEQIEAPAMEHHHFLDRTLKSAAAEPDGAPLVFLDPDICLWASCEDFAFDGLVAGKLVDPYDDDIMRCVTAPRLHSSFLWIPDPRRLVEEIQTLQRVHRDFEPFLPYSVRVMGSWVRFDTGASLFSAMEEFINN